MKKTLLMALALTTALVAETPTTPECSPFQGFYFGAEVGAVSANTSGKVTDYTNASFGADRNFAQKDKKDKRQAAFSYGLIGGYGMTIGDAYVGAEFGLLDDTAPRKVNLFVQDKANNSKIEAGGTASYKRGVVFSFAPRLGYIFNKSTLLYVKPAVEISKDVIEFDNAWSTNALGVTTHEKSCDKSKTKTVVTFAPAVGLEKAISKNVLARIEYAYNFGGRITHYDDQVKYTSHAVKFGLAYKF
jgi:opacity protein-like surface antigen